jgi:ATP-dependent Zn protease
MITDYIKYINTAYEKAESIIEKNIELFNIISDNLITRKSLNKEELISLITHSNVVTYNK